MALSVDTWRKLTLSNLEAVFEVLDNLTLELKSLKQTNQAFGQVFTVLRDLKPDSIDGHVRGIDGVMHAIASLKQDADQAKMMEQHLRAVLGVYANDGRSAVITEANRYIDSLER